MKNNELIISMLKDSIKLADERLCIKDSAIARLMDQVQELKENIMTNDQAKLLAYAYANYANIRVADLDHSEDCIYAENAAMHLKQVQKSTDCIMVGEERIQRSIKRVQRLQSVYDSE
jgi:hypothetical protein